ncbi:MAG: hypothetical protein K2N05_09615 [Muribaculaceae bacterium]|nr:hypothetical protein [Muribaculaceae bacterium]
MKLRNIILILITFSFSLTSFAVSDKDMEQAKVEAAKLYLRWTNNGSGYLDDVTASSMADLESKLKAQEKENLKAFKSVNIPSDYASWDKQRFVQFWGTTFFTSPALSADGKRAKDRVKAKVSAMNVSAPTAAPAATTASTAPAETPQAPAPEESENPGQEETPKVETPPENAISIPEPTEIKHEEEALADSLQMIQAEEDNMARADRPEKAKSNTWIYVVILIVLVILVVWLMVYAANMMKKQNSDSERDQRRRDRDEKSPRKDSDKQFMASQAAIEKLQEENARLKSQLEAAKAEIIRQKGEGNVPTASPVKKGMTAAISDAMQVKEEPKHKPQPKVINEIFLGRANPKGQFVRGDRRPNPDHTVYRLDTKDGIVGTFRFAETPDAFALATSNPLQYLAGGCICENFEDADTASRIITDAPGTAVLENGCWKVLRKSKIRFE